MLKALAAYPRDLPLLALAGTGRHQVLALKFSEIDPASALRRPLASRPRPGSPFRRGLIGVLAYDDAPHRMFDVRQALLVDRDTGAVEVTAAPDAPTQYAVSDSGIADLIRATRVPDAAKPLQLAATWTDAKYESMVSQVLADIRAGRYYQLNLLRYFDTSGVTGRDWLVARLEANGGPQAALVDVPDLTLASFSPERFLRLTPTATGLVAEAHPIKGTAPRYADPAADARAAAALAASPKDLAELHMIVDLLRSDLNRVAVRGSVVVAAADELVSLATVHHLQAVVRARLAGGLTFGDLLAATAPCGSITGAPKREVMAAIRAYEGRPRGYFMGSAFYLDDSGAFDSSILIRTLVRRGDSAYAFAAGSGIVVHSDPEQERLEIEAKCRVVTSWS